MFPVVPFASVYAPVSKFTVSEVEEVYVPNAAVPYDPSGRW